MSCSELAKWFIQEKHTDVTFVAPEKSGGVKRSSSGKLIPGPPTPPVKEIHGHKTLLASKCPTFEKMFFAKDFKNRVILPPDTDMSGFRSFLMFLYTDVLDSSNIVHVFRNAMEFQVEINPADFKRLLNETNVGQLFCIALKWNADRVKEFRKILETRIADYAHDIIPLLALEVTRIDRLTAIQILNIPDLNITPVPLFKAIEAYAEAQCRAHGIAVTLKNKKMMLCVSLSSLRCVQEVYDDITPEEYNELRKYYKPDEEDWGLLTENEFRRMNPAARVTSRKQVASVSFNNLEILPISTTKTKPKNMITVHVKHWNNGSLLPAEVRPNSTLDMLKVDVDYLYGIAPEDQRIFLFGTRLQGNLKLSEYGILDGSIISLR